VTTELGLRASPVSPRAWPQTRFILAAIGALIVVAGATVITWLAAGTAVGLWVLAVSGATDPSGVARNGSKVERTSPT
jgi:type IV secretory pathway TrbD component